MWAGPANFVQVEGVGDAAAEGMAGCVGGAAALAVQAAAALVAVEEASRDGSLRYGLLARSLLNDLRVTMVRDGLLLISASRHTATTVACPPETVFTHASEKLP